MNKPTDTNQASEDDLRKKIDKALHIDWAFNKSKPTKIIIDGSATKGAYHTSYDLFVDNILDLIRTEKLKLLAEVRERVVGEDMNVANTGDTFKANYARGYNVSKVEMRDKLTQLEAEL